VVHERVSTLLLQRPYKCTCAMEANKGWQSIATCVTRPETETEMGALTVRTSSGMVAENRRVCLLIKIRTLSSMNREPDTPRNDSSIRQEGYDCLQVFPEASIK